MWQPQALDKSSYGVWRCLSCRALYQLDDRAADDRSIRELRHFGNVFRIADAESDGHRQPLSHRPCPSPDAANERSRVAGYALLRSRDAHT